MSILTRKKTECETHDWSVTVTAGLRRSLCRSCGTLTLEPVPYEFSLSSALEDAAEAVR